MPFEIRKISNYGTGHPVVARLAMQTSELIQWSDLNEADRGQVLELYFHVLKPRLLKCHEAYDRLCAARDEALKVLELPPQKDSRVRDVPHVIGLREEAEAFLYEAKNYLRDSLRVLSIFFGEEFPEKLVAASSYYDAKAGKKSALVDWSEKKFGPDDPFTKQFVGEQPWAEGIIRNRNAAEHPGGNSGTLFVHNIEVSDAGLIPPTWQRDDGPRTDLFKDIDVSLENLLTLAEDTLIGCIVHRSSFKEIQFVEIPVEQRNAQAPQRITVQLSEKLRAQFPIPQRASK